MKTPNRAVDRIVRLDVNDFEGRLLERWKANVLNKKIGLIICFRVMEHFNINVSDLKDNREKEIELELIEQQKLLEEKLKEKKESVKNSWLE